MRSLYSYVMYLIIRVDHYKVKIKARYTEKDKNLRTYLLTIKKLTPLDQMQPITISCTDSF